MPADLRLDELEKAAVEARDAAAAEDAFVVRTPGCESRPSQNPEYRAAWQRSADAHDALATLADPQTVLLLIAAARERDRLAGEVAELRGALRELTAAAAVPLETLVQTESMGGEIRDISPDLRGAIRDAVASCRRAAALLGEGGGG